MIDSGIDYQNEVFRNAGGSRIAYLWDQSLEEESDMGAAKVPYGRLFRKRDIDLALDSENPFSIVRPGIPTATVRRWQALLPEIWFREKISQEQRQRQPLSL